MEPGLISKNCFEDFLTGFLRISLDLGRRRLSFGGAIADAGSRLAASADGGGGAPHGRRQGPFPLPHETTG